MPSVIVPIYAGMNSEKLIKQLASSVSPKDADKARIRHQLMARIDAPEVLTQSKDAVLEAVMKERIWKRIAQGIAAPVRTRPAFDALHQQLSPSQEIKSFLQQKIAQRLQPAIEQRRAFWGVKWVASFAVIALLVNMSPALFLAPATIAESQVLLLPTDGQVSVLVRGSWQDVSDEMVLHPGMRLRTYDGSQATVVFRDDGVLRLNEATTIAIHDTSERLEVASEVLPTFSLIAGQVWLQGLVPASVRGLTIASSFGHVTVHEGSVSLQDLHDTVAVRTWDRHAIVSHQGEQSVLVAGEQTEMREANTLLTKKIDSKEFTQGWAYENLARDAVHRRHIAHLQQERRASLAGILPTSHFYPVKRVAEEVDVLLSFDGESRVQKRLEQANVRLNEAAALLADGSDSTEIVDSLDAFEGALLEVASGSGGDMAAQFLIRQSLTETFADVAAALPGDQSYVLKKAVLDATVQLPEEVVDESAVQEVLVADAFDTLIAAVESKDTAELRRQWMAIQPSLALIENEESSLHADVRKEAHHLLGRIASIVSDLEDDFASDPELLEDIVAFIPEEEVTQTTVVYLSDEHVAAIVQSMIDRIYAFKMPKSRMNQLRVELLAISGHEDEGRFLRALHEQLPEASKLTDTLRRRIVQLRWQRAGEVVQQQSGTDVVEEI